MNEKYLIKGIFIFIWVIIYYQKIGGIFMRKVSIEYCTS